MTWVTRWDGTIDGWPVAWADGVIEAPVVDITATDRLQRLTSRRVLRHPLMEHFKTGGTTGTPLTFGRSRFGDGSVFPGAIAWLYPLQEDPTATAGGDVSGSPTYRVMDFAGASGLQRFGTTGLLPEGTMLTLATDPDPLKSPPPLPTAPVGLQSGGSWTVFAAFSVSQGEPTHTGGKVQILRVGVDSTIYLLDASLTVWVTSSTIVAEWRGWALGSGAVTRTLTDMIDLCDGRAHWLTVSCDGTTMSLRVDTRTPVTGAKPANMLKTRMDTLALGNPNADELTVSLAWVGAAESVLDSTELATLVLGLSERSDVRVARYLDWVGIPSGDRSLETGVASVGHIPTTGRAALDAAAEVNSVEQGVLFASGSSIVFHSRDHRDTDTPVMSIPLEALDASLSVAVDTATLVNDYTVSRPGGSQYRAVNVPSVLAFGRFTASATIPAATDADLQSAANSLVQRLGTPAPRCPRLVFDLLTLDDETVGRLMRLEVGDLINVLMPSNSPGGPLALFVEGLEDSIATDRASITEWSLTVSTSPGGRARRTRIGPKCLFGTARFS